MPSIRRSISSRTGDSIPKHPETPEGCLEKYIEEDVKPRCVEYTAKKYRWNIVRIQDCLKDAGLRVLPYEITRNEIEYLISEQWSELEATTRSWYLSLYSSYLMFFGNRVIHDMRLRKEQDRRTNVDWLSPIEVATLLQADLTPLERLVIHLELQLGLRKVEVIRLRLQDIRMGYLEVHGKGGKWRTVPFHKDTEQIIEAWRRERDRMVREALRYMPYLNVPDNLIIWCRYRKKPMTGAYSENGNGLDRKVIAAVRERYELQFANHTLRRSFGRSLWLTRKLPEIPTVPTETISKIMGHEDVATTLKYIGVNLDDMSDTMSALLTYENALKKENGLNTIRRKT